MEGIDKFKNEFTPEIEQARKNNTCARLLEQSEKLPNESRILFEIAIGLAYNEGKIDGFQSEVTNIRV